MDVELCSAVLVSVLYKMDIVKLEIVQRRITKIIQGLRNLTYKDTLKHPNLHSLEKFRIRGNLIEVFKWIKDFNIGDINKVLIVKRSKLKHEQIISN